MSGERGPRPEDGKDKFALVLRSLEEIGTQNAKGAEATEALIAVLSHPKDGLICALDDLLTEIQGLREDLQGLRAGGGIIGKLFGG